MSLFLQKAKRLGSKIVNCCNSEIFHRATPLAFIHFNKVFHVITKSSEGNGRGLLKCIILFYSEHIPLLNRSKPTSK